MGDQMGRVCLLAINQHLHNEIRSPEINATNQRT